MMVWWIFPTKQTAPNQLLAFIAVIAVGPLIVGGVLLYLSTGQPPEKLELAARARSLGVKCIIASAVIGFLTWLGNRFVA